MFDRVVLEQEQKDLFIRLVEAAKSLPRAQRQKFEFWQLQLDQGTQAWIDHPGFGDDSLYVYTGDIEALSEAGLIRGVVRSKDLIELDITPYGFQYYDSMTQPAQLDTRQQLQRVLETIASYQKQNPSSFTSDTFIAERLGLDIEDVRAYLDLLEADGMTKAANSFDGHAAILTGKGRIAMKDPNYFQTQPVTNSTTNNFSGTFQGAIFNIESTLSDVNQTIGLSPNLDQPTKDELMALVQQLQAELQQVPADKTDEAEAVADYAKDLIETATKEKPNKTKALITADGLKKAAENLAAVLPTVVTIATQIVAKVQPLLP